MIKPFHKFWIFHITYWVFVGVVLFIYGLGYGHWEVAFIRNIYNPLIGMGLSLLMVNIYNRLSSNRLPFVLLLSFGAALISSILVNPVTYALLGYDIRNLALSNIFQDVLYFALFYVVWSLLYLQMVRDPNFQEKNKEHQKLSPIPVSKENKKYQLDPKDITHIQANGDYVEFFTANNQYLKQGTISFYEEALNSGPFKRIHRSTIINTEKIQSISGPSKGQFWIKLGEAHEVRSSRNYQTTIEALLPKAE